MNYRIVAALMLFLCGIAGTAGPAFAADPPAPRIGQLLRAVHAGTALWLLYDDGVLRRLDDDATTARVAQVDGRAFDLCVRGDAPIVAAIVDHKAVFRRLGGSGWAVLGSVPLSDTGRIVGIACQGAAPLLLTSDRVAVLGQPPLAVAGVLPPGVRYSLYRDGDSLLAGSNAGEWGGGLVRIDLHDGAVTVIQGAGAPVQDIAPAPGKPGCMLIAVGLVHFMPSGRLTELCGTTPRHFFAAPFAVQGWRAVPGKPDDDPYPGVAFYGFAATDNGLIAIGIDGLREITAAGVGPVRPLPGFTERGGVRIAMLSPKLWLVLTGINARVSVGGAMPLAVPLGVE